jgi:hypothetical protein
MPARKRVSFIARRSVAKPVRVKFYTRSGGRVAFTARRKVVKPVRVQFYAKKKR